MLDSLNSKCYNYGNILESENISRELVTAGRGGELYGTFAD
jgi:hypothetical protein